MFNTNFKGPIEILRAQQSNWKLSKKKSTVIVRSKSSRHSYPERYVLLYVTNKCKTITALNNWQRVSRHKIRISSRQCAGRKMWPTILLSDSESLCLLTLRFSMVFLESCDFLHGVSFSEYCSWFPIFYNSLTVFTFYCFWVILILLFFWVLVYFYLVFLDLIQ